MDILTKLLSLLAPLALGYLLKKVHFLGAMDYRVLAKLALNITLPAAVISSFANFTMDYSLLSIIVLAFFSNWVALLFTYATTRRDWQDRKLRSLKMICASSFNMGNFLIPFVQQFLGGSGVALTALFDSGNSFMATGGVYIFTTSVIKADGEKVTLRDIFRKLFHSVPILTYITLIVLALLGTRPPAALVTIVQPTGNANAFVSMFMIGLMFEIRFDKAYLKTAFGILGRKYFCALLLALAFYFLLPFDLMTRQVLVMCAFAPIPSIASIYTEQIQGDVELASFTTSASFLISCGIMIVLMTTL
ncbi:AEC family transporter [Hominifimenecus sp. rT4P-3]|uniref:AEC family transporter n=1 Tax=Hominifimenecus sp. rT4P-3 TaxID=3242979 RepID=UPI003DA55C33